jgi:hypothetical protein
MNVTRSAFLMSSFNSWCFLLLQINILSYNTWISRT